MVLKLEAEVLVRKKEARACAYGPWKRIFGWFRTYDVQQYKMCPEMFKILNCCFAMNHIRTNLCPLTLSPFFGVSVISCSKLPQCLGLLGAAQKTPANDLGEGI